MSNVYKNDTDWWMKAFELAKFGEHRVKVGCLAVVRGNPVAGTWNTLRNYESNVNFTEMTVHAEMACLSLVSERLRPSATFYIARIGKSGYSLPSHPCDRCMVELKRAGIKYICATDLVQNTGDIPQLELNKYKL